MRQFIGQVLAAFVALALIGGGVWLIKTLPAWAGFEIPPAVWDGNYELDPLNTDSVSEGDDHMRAMKEEIRERAETEHDWGTLATGSGDTNDNGRHRLGSARTFGQAAAPADPNCLQENDYDSTGGAGADRACDDGRMWVEFDNGGRLRGYDENGVGEDRSDQSADGFFDLIALPTNAIILWDQALGDENCDGATTAGDCPCGFTRAAEFDGIYARGAETVATVTDVPEEVGTDCSAHDGAVPDGACDGANAEYDDILDTAEMPAHTHGLGSGVFENAAGGATINSGGGRATLGASDSTGGGDPHYHPFRTVLYCRAS